MADQIQFELVSPERLLVSRPVEMVVVPGVEGDFGALPGHAPLISAVRPGVLAIFENRSFDNLLGRLYGPEDGKVFEGVIGKELSNPIPEWAEHGAERKTLPYAVGTDMDAPNPDSGEEYFHTNVQLFNLLEEQNRFKTGEEVSAPWNAPEPGAAPTMDGFVTDYISTFTAEMGRQPTFAEYAQIMSCIFLLISGPGRWSLDARLLKLGNVPQKDNRQAPEIHRAVA